MGSRRRLADLLVLTAVCWALVVPAAQAYIDAGSTSVIFQAAVAGIAAGWMFVKLFWQRVRRFFAGDRDDAGHERDDAGEAPTTAGSDGAGTGPEVR